MASRRATVYRQPAADRLKCGLFILTAQLCLLTCFPVCAETNAFDAASATLETLVLHAQRYGSTQEKKEKRKQAREELFARGAESLHFLMQNMHIENDAIAILAGTIVRAEKIDHAESAAVLIEYLESDEDRTRSMSAYFLGFCETPEYADHLLPLLDDPKVAGAAIRTLGKWKISAAAECAAGFLDHNNERRRVLAANALREMEAVHYAPELIAALNDVTFTVRKSAAKALSTFGGSIEPRILHELKFSRGLARRELIRVLGELGSRKAKAELETLLSDPDLAVRADVKQALEAISRR